MNRSTFLSDTHTHTYLDTHFYFPSKACGNLANVTWQSKSSCDDVHKEHSICFEPLEKLGFIVLTIQEWKKESLKVSAFLSLHVQPNIKKKKPMQ